MDVKTTGQKITRRVMRDTKKGVKKAKLIRVDMQNRLERSFGRRLDQLAEIHYRGKPMVFGYNGFIELLSVDVLHREEQEEGLGRNNNAVIPPVETVEQFDNTKRRLDMAKVKVSCSCGATFDTMIPVALAKTGNKNVKENLADVDIQRHIIQDHAISVDYVEIRDEVIPETNRIKDFDTKKINFYRIFPKKTTEIRYLVSYDQDLLSEAPQIKFSDSQAGSKILRKQNLLMMYFLFGVMEIATYMFASSQAYIVGPPVNNNPWYVTIFIAVLAIVGVWAVRIHEMGKTMIKDIRLQSGPFYISNRGILPVVMTNSTLTDVWDYQGNVMQSDDRAARNIYYSLTTWSDSQIAELYRAKILGQVEHELTVVQSEIRDIQKLDYSYRTQTTKEKADIQQLAIVGIAVFLIYSVFLILFGIL